MATVTIRRAAVRQPPPPTEPLVVPAPPARPAPAPPTGRSALAGLPMLAAAAVTLAGPASGQLLAGLLGLAGLLLLTGGRRRPPSGARVAYLEELGRLRQRARSVAVNQHTTGHHRHPDPHALWTLVPGPRLWERRPTDPDFGQARIGLGPQPLAGPLCPPARPDDGWDPVAADALRRFLAAHRFVPDQPVTLPLTEPGRTSVRGGTRADRAALGRAALAQLAVFQPPDELRIVIAAAPDRRDDWEWIKWLPHATHPVRRDAAGPLRSVVDTPAAVAALLDQLSPTEGAVVLVLDGITTTVGEAHPRVAVLDLDPPPLSPGPDGAGPGETVTLDPTGPGGLGRTG